MLPANGRFWRTAEVREPQPTVSSDAIDPFETFAGRPSHGVQTLDLTPSSCLFGVLINALSRAGGGKIMRRREFITLLGGGIAWPLAAHAQENGRTYRLGSLHQSPRDAPHHVAFFDELRRLGFVEGKNLLGDEHGYGLHIEELAQHASELVKSQVDVIVCAGVAPVRAAQEATKTISIVGNADDLVASGLVRSLANPEGNTTGFSILATELDGKRQEILMEVVPTASSYGGSDRRSNHIAAAAPNAPGSGAQSRG